MECTVYWFIWFIYYYYFSIFPFSLSLKLRTRMYTVGKSGIVQTTIPKDPSRTICRRANCCISGSPESLSHDTLASSLRYVFHSPKRIAYTCPATDASRLAVNLSFSIVRSHPVIVKRLFTIGSGMLLLPKGRQMGFILEGNCTGLSRRKWVLLYSL